MARAWDHGGGRGRGWLLAGWALGVVGVPACTVARPLPGDEDEAPWVIGPMAFPVAAAVVLAQRPGNVIGRLLATVATSAGAIFALSWYAQALPDAPLSRQLEALGAIPAVVQFGGILGLLNLFPTGQPLHRVHGWVVAALWWYTALFAVLGVVAPGPLTLTGRPNPFGWARRGCAPRGMPVLPASSRSCSSVCGPWSHAGAAPA